MISSAERNRLLAVVLIALCFLGCGVDQTEPLPAPVSAAATTTLRLEMVSGAARPGDTVCVALRLSDTSAGDPIAGLQGTIRFDPRRLRYAGQVAEPPTLAMVGDDHAADGMLRVLAVSPRGLPSRVAVLAFEVVSSGYEAGLSYESTRVVSRGLIDEAVAVTPGVVPPSGALPASPSIRRLGVAEWGDLLAPGLPNEARVPGQIVPGLRYGDITLNGTINVLDVVAASDVAVGMADLIINPSVDVVVAGNVAPFNLPGLGEPDDLYPPGRETDGSYRIDVMDVVAISDEAVGLNPPVVGDLIPGRFAPLGTDRRVIVSGNIASDRSF
jgi:hypothetical protein